jgi:VanZ family protein
MWLPPAAWAALIFVFSSDVFSSRNTASIVEGLLRFLLPAFSAAVIELLHFFIRKLGHFGEYFVLSILVLRALLQKPHARPAPRQLAIALAITGLYAISDELHQAWAPTRSASAMDVVIDIFGGICGTFWFHRRNHGRNSL